MFKRLLAPVVILIVVITTTFGPLLLYTWIESGKFPYHQPDECEFYVTESGLKVYPIERPWRFEMEK